LFCSTLISITAVLEVLDGSDASTRELGLLLVAEMPKNQVHFLIGA